MPLPKQGSNLLFSNSFFIFITRFFPSLASLLVIIWYSRHLSPDVYGNYQRFWIQLNVIYPLACFGIHVLIVTYSRGFILNLLERIKARHYMLYALWIMMLSGLFAILEYKSLNVTFLIPFLFMLAWSLSTIFESFLIVGKNYRSIVSINILYSAAFCFIHWFVLQQGFSLQALFTYLFVLVGLRLCIYAGITIGDMKRAAGEVTEDFALSSVRALWLHLGVYDVTQMLFNWIDKFIIAFLLTASLSAVYYNGTQNIPFLPLLMSAAGSAVLIQLAGGKKADETANIIAYMNKSGRLLSCIVFPIFFFLLFFRHQLIITLFTEKYAAAVPIFAVAILVLPLKSYSFTTVLQRLHKGNIINIGSLVDLVLACGLMYPLYLWLGLPGVALSFVITTYLQAGFYLFYSAKLLQVSPLKLIPYVDWIIKLIVFAIVFITIHYAFGRYFTEKISLILGIGVMAVVSMTSLLIELNKQKRDGRI